MQFGIALVVAGARCLTASSLSGTVINEGFVPQSGVPVKLLLESKRALQQSISTDKNGVFTFSDLAPGDYSVRVDSSPFLSVEIQNIHIVEGEDRRLRRILLEAGEAAGNCVVRIMPASHFQHTSGKDVEISGRVLIGRGESAAVTLIVFTENQTVTPSTVSDNHGRFRFMVAVAGDIRLGFEIRNRSGKTIIPEQQANVGWADVGDRVAIPSIRLKKPSLGHLCY